MKKLLLSLLFVLPAFGYTGGGEFVYERNSMIDVQGDDCTVVWCDKNSGVVKSNGWAIPFLVYREHILQSVKLPNGRYTLSTEFPQTTLRFSNAAKLLGIGALVAGGHYAAKYQLGTDYQTKVMKFLSTQKDNFLTVVSPVITQLGATAAAAGNSIKGFFKMPESVSKAYETASNAISEKINQNSWLVSKQEIVLP